MISRKIENVQTSEPLGSARLLRKILENWGELQSHTLSCRPSKTGAEVWKDNIIRTVTKGLLKGRKDLEVGGRVETIQTTTFFENGRNTEKSPGDLRRLAVTQNSSERPSANADVKNSYE